MSRGRFETGTLHYDNQESLLSKKKWIDIPDIRKPPFSIPASVCKGREKSVLAVLPDEVTLFLRFRALEFRSAMFLDNLLHNLGGIVDCSWRRALQLEEQVVRDVILVARRPRNVRRVHER